MTKNPEEYADKNTQPHVQVALQLKARGLQVRVGDTIPYVICKPLEATSGEKGSELIANRAFHPDDVKKDGSMFKIGKSLLVHAQRLYVLNFIFLY